MYYLKQYVDMALRNFNRDFNQNIKTLKIIKENNILNIYFYDPKTLDLKNIENSKACVIMTPYMNIMKEVLQYKSFKNFVYDNLKAVFLGVMPYEYDKDNMTNTKALQSYHLDKENLIGKIKFHFWLIKGIYIKVEFNRFIRHFIYGI